MGSAWRRPRLDAELGAQRHGLGVRFRLYWHLLPDAQWGAVHRRGQTGALQAFERDRNARGKRLQHRRGHQKVSAETTGTGTQRYLNNDGDRMTEHVVIRRKSNF